MQRELITSNWYALFLFISLSCCALTNFLKPRIYVDLLKIPFNNRYFINAKDKPSFEAATLLLIVNYILMLGLLIYVSFLYFNDHYSFSVLHFLTIIAGLIGFMSFKFLIEYLISWVFDIKDIVTYYLFQKFAFIKQTGIFLIPFILLMIFSTLDKKVVIISSIIVFSVLKVGGFIIVLRKNQKYINSHFFYFLLYLCALEIAPYILIYSVLSNSNF